MPVSMNEVRERMERNTRITARYDELMREGKHGHYETMFRIVREEIERDRNLRSVLVS